MKDDLNTAWRITAATIYGPPKDGKVYGTMDVDVTEALEFIAQARKKGLKLTMTHLVIAVLSRVFGEDVPDVNAYVARGRLRQRPCVIASTTVMLNRDGELGLVRVHDSDKKSIEEIVGDFNREWKSTLGGSEEKAIRNKELAARLPWLLRKLVFGLVVLFSARLGWNIPFLGIRTDTFGSFLVSNIGSLGVTEGFSALLPAGNIPAVFTIGKPEEKVVVNNGKMVIRTIMRLGASMDHRVIDGFHASQLIKHIRRRFQKQLW